MTRPNSDQLLSMVRQIDSASALSVEQWRRSAPTISRQRRGGDQERHAVDEEGRRCAPLRDDEAGR